MQDLRVMQVWIARSLGLLGAIALAAGLVNIVAPGMVFPSVTTCVTHYDLIVCDIETWAAAPWLALSGGLAVTIAARIGLVENELAS